MIKKMRIKFIVLTMVSLLLVLTLIVGSINLLNYQKTVRDADAILRILAENNGSFPKLEPGKRGKGRNMSPETPYETRYFSVLMDMEGNTISADTGKIAAIDSAEAIEYAQNVRQRAKEKGFAGNYRYICQMEGDWVRVIFLDCERGLTIFQNFLLTSCGASALGLLAVLCLILVFSGRIIKPVSESYEKQKRFITDAGHEIKTPLTIIDADADVLEMDIGENQWLADIKKQVGRLTELTNSLICLSRMEEDQNQFQMLEFPLSDVVEETARSFQSLALTQNKTFTMDIRPLLSLYGDEKALRQLTGILLDNALKYSGEGGKISLSLEKKKRTICLCVSNTTQAPVAPENLNRIFDRFYRMDSSRNSGTGGYGIGLSIARAITAAHKGKISAAALEENGLSITVMLPVRKEAQLLANSR